MIISTHTATVERRTALVEQTATTNTAQIGLRFGVISTGGPPPWASSYLSSVIQASVAAVEAAAPTSAAIASLSAKSTTCGSGTAFYLCANGFVGCCSVDPCNPGETCPDVTSTTSTPPVEITSTIIMTATAAGKTATSGATTTTKHSSTGTSSASKTSSIASSTAVPSCPGGNNTQYADGSNIKYTVLCNQDNEYPNLSQISVSTGGYAECFSSCSNTSKCAGFVFDGLSDGICYLKGSLPADLVVFKNGSNYITAAKVDLKASVPLPSGPVTPVKKHLTAGAIAGIVIGALALLALLLFLIACCAKRRRKKVEERRATITHIIQGPMETQPLAGKSAGHARTGSTGNDVFAPYGGFYRGFSHAQAGSHPAKDEKSMSFGMTAEIGPMAAAVLARSKLQSPSADDVAMLDSTPIKRPISQSEGPRSPKFHEHIAEMEDSSPVSNPAKELETRSPVSDMDSPTLGRTRSSAIADALRRKSHMLSWNNYDSSKASESGEEEVLSGTMYAKSPPSQVSPNSPKAMRDSKFIVSPVGSVERAAK